MHKSKYVNLKNPQKTQNQTETKKKPQTKKPQKTNANYPMLTSGNDIRVTQLSSSQ